ncbi:FKBP-type peptidyl-prolyl cis-trans isomerase [Arthrobacter jinronghuae]|uniref:Peptidyl-prolyl cis-trans isomerase n=1 Tax=Arthrobacter jinronghuae TaxID=2964609 RepID=A0ABT1NRI6_9MICC|nr:FKBP-type peptidyl-prolyl cis-trans isomerase [Arthrobacter jinronghuae]MCQ1950222.1 FKBP-type peptidyl-prolyl cis-trans isomerase [Arthrobacter jinronghuae]MCQ1953379.1 FKBP-type peptidyl-prolyl cis-trans isomerase [Arthrobacter sp. zg-Y238]MCQ1956613.1 FKBP-type peptidyl-prolyl cis-trans isomerase [Arthrobacter jinronghuae]UWX77206.1 FKBP-type peptidyl-prolyl cis-trans isomerase [Arthrobacter jinronghuae]
MRKVLAILLPFLLFLTACSGDDEAKSSGPLSSVKIERGDDETSVPSVEFDEPLSVEEPTLTRINDGDGDEVADGQTAMIRLAIVNPEDGTVGQETYSAENAEGIAVNESLKTGNSQMYDALLGAPVGSDFAYYIPANEESGTEANFLVFTITDAMDTVPTLTPDEAAARNADGTLLMSSEDVDALEAEGKLPEVTFAEDGTPSITIPEGAEEPERLVVKVLEEGDGPVLESTGTVVADYLGVGLRDGETFDSSYERGEPAEFPLGNVIPGWTYGLAEQKAGSKVLLVLPSELAYGDPAGGSSPSGPLVFVVDIKEVK